MKLPLLVESYLLLMKIDLLMRFGSLRAVDHFVRHRVVATERPSGRIGVDVVCRAVDLAAVLYWKPVLCLQRSAATTILLRRYGWRAELVIGTQILPFKSHAWVEINCEVVNDQPYMREIYRVLERCQVD